MGIYIAIDLKSFYASVECSDQMLNPLTTNLVVADVARTEKTICLAVSPSLKKYGIPGRARLFEVIQRIKEVNAERLMKAPNHTFTGKSHDSEELSRHPEYELDFIAATPRMARYIQYSTRIYEIYLRYIAPEDIHVYSIDEVLMDVTGYLETYRLSPRELASKIIHTIMEETGITATAGIGTNLYLCKVAMDILAKHAPPDAYGVRIAELDEISYRKELWNHRPLTDFWRVGRGYAKKLEQVGLMTMGDIARCSLGKDTDYYNEDLLFKLFGVNAELLIDHAWGVEPCGMSDIKAYKPENNSISSGQVLQSPYDYQKTRIIVMEMAELLSLDLVSKRMQTDQLVLSIGYDIDNLTNPEISKDYHGEVKTDFYGRLIPKHAHGSISFDSYTSSTRLIVEKALELFESIMDPKLLSRRINIAANHIVSDEDAAKKNSFTQLSLMDLLEEKSDADKEHEIKERKLQEAVLSLQHKFGKNTVLKGMNLEEGAMTRERNQQIGGHKA